MFPLISTTTLAITLKTRMGTISFTIQWPPFSLIQGLFTARIISRDCKIFTVALGLPATRILWVKRNAKIIKALFNKIINLLLRSGKRTNY